MGNLFAGYGGMIQYTEGISLAVEVVDPPTPAVVYYGPWLNVARGHEFNLFLDSEAGGDVNIYLDISPLSASTLPDQSVDTTLYVRKTIQTSYTLTAGTMAEINITLPYPFVSCRVGLESASGEVTVDTLHLMKYD